ncbi:phosphomannomutase/phosphoglucomutase [Terasakiella sp. A23]|uniref:phosphoglucomutase/phosphomannomutase PgmG n=1 Tax=Terasakiella sp. FCG-A23 TaxID=3080561 RepID=UPI002954A6E9|nr:phosphomannomutase/phosphoglucomutase [Terasakiella sp. A23]MDV7338563.1 phosphomannomutase/phosphoglucomutase [Terasakiella sp. A23]
MTSIINPTILREYDIRGIVGDTFTEEVVETLGRAFGTRIKRAGGKSVAVGYDGRLSSPGLAAAAVRGLMACGLKVFEVGRGPTPMLYYATYALETDAGLMITGSHNPPDYNGMKMMMSGLSFFGADIQDLGVIAEKEDYESGEGSTETHLMLDAYVERMLADFKPGKELKIAWDAGNGVAGEAMTMMCDKLPGKHFLLYADIDGNFPNHHPDPTVEKNLADLKDAVRSKGCDLGIAFDGDGDRIGVVDSQGRVLWGDQLMVVWAKEILSRKPGSTIIADVKASQVLFDEVARMGGEPMMWKTGHSLIKSKMKELSSPFAGEMSGHIFFKDGYYGFDDALYAAIRLISILTQTDEKLDDMLDAMPKMVNTPEIRFDCAEERKFDVAEEVKARLASDDRVEVIAVDGVRVVTEDGWWLLRASNTQPVLVARCEAKDEAGLERLKASLVEQLEASNIEAPEM